MKRTAVTASILLACPLAAGAQTFGVPNTSNQAPAGSPIQIEDCKAGQDGGLLIAQSDGNFEVVFTNEGATTADLIRFEIDFGRERLFIRDAGKFSPGITITHRFRRRGGNVVSSPLFSPAKLSCSVASVHFADGTEWTPSASAGAAISVLGNGYIGVMFKQEADGVYAQLVLPASPAQNADIEQGDRIANIESNAITTVSEAIQLISATPPGAKLHLTLMRNGKPLIVTAIVGQRPTSQQ